MDHALLQDLRKVDELRLAGAAAADGIARLVAAGAAAGLTEGESLSTLGLHVTLWRWCQRQSRLLEEQQPMASS